MRKLPALLFLSLLLSYAYFFQGGGWNANSRLDLTRALVDGRIAIDAYQRNTGDWAYFEGHFYTNKAPGLSVVSAPVFQAGTMLLDVAGLREQETRLRILGYACTVLVIGVPSALLGVLLFFALGNLGVPDQRARAWAVLTFGLGTLAFPYATAYYAHQPAAVLGFGAFVAILRARGHGTVGDTGTAAAKGPTGGAMMATAAGALAGAAVVFEMSCLLIAVVLGLWLLRTREGRRLLPWFIAGGVPFAIGLGLYNWAAFGGPTIGPFQHANPAVEERVRGALFGLPTPARLYGVLLSPYRGLLFTSPILALAAIPAGWRVVARADRESATICLVVVLAFIALTTSFHAWHGGWAPGSRYLIPALPFLFVPVAAAMAQHPRVAAVLAAVSVTLMLSITTVAIEIPGEFANPLADFVFHHLAAGHVSVNSQGLDAFLPTPGYAELDFDPNWSSFNLGELLWPHRLVSMVPLLALWMAFVVVLVRQTGGDRATGRKE